MQIKNERIVDYRVVEAFSLQDLEFKISNVIGAGWQPIGGVSVSYINIGSSLYAQAAVKYEYETE